MTMTDRPNDAPNESGDPEDAMTADRGRDALDEVQLDGLDEDGGTVIAGPQDRSDIANLRGGQHDAATGGSDLGASTGGGDTGAV
jgi:hypothetical protein